jgi:hypothetical protein
VVVRLAVAVAVPLVYIALFPVLFPHLKKLFFAVSVLLLSVLAVAVAVGGAVSLSLPLYI